MAILGTLVAHGVGAACSQDQVTRSISNSHGMLEICGAPCRFDSPEVHTEITSRPGEICDSRIPIERT
jgi:hypothetical protein